MMNTEVKERNQVVNNFIKQQLSLSSLFTILFYRNEVREVTSMRRIATVISRFRFQLCNL